MSLLALIKKGGLRGLATVTPATSATDGALAPPSVASVATVAVATAQNKAAQPAHPQRFPTEAFVERTAIKVVELGAACIEEAPQTGVYCDGPPDPDRHCWPQGMAMNTAEIDSFLLRQARFERQGLPAEVAEDIADSLMKRDRDGCQDMVLCLECVHLRRAGQWTCVNWQQAGWTASAMPRDLVQQMQRCPGFREGS
jgi:hypothetical protein